MPLDLSATATKLLAKLGSTTYVTAIDRTGGVFDPVLGTKEAVTETTTTLTAAVIDIKTDLDQDTRIARSENTAKQIIFDNTYTPTMKTIFEFGGVKYKTVEIDGFNHAGTQQFWKVTCQK